MSEYLKDGASIAGPGAYDAGHGVSFTPYYLDEECTQLGGLYMWHPCPRTKERFATDAEFPSDGITGVGPNAKTGQAWGYENAEDPSAITLVGSVLDPDCGWHGFVRGGRWEPC